MRSDVTLRARVKLEMWASPPEGRDVDWLATRLAEQGVTVLEIDREQQRILVRREEH